MTNEPLLSIITPTYNRASLLPRLYQSLKNQTSKNFEWIIVDDGSTDNTLEIVNSFNLQTIDYYKIENGGKHRALNFGIPKCRGLLTFIVDSDDWLVENAVEIIESYLNEYKQDNDLCGFSFLRAYPDGQINSSFNNKNDIVVSNNIRYKKNVLGDMAEVYYTSILKKYPFPEIEGEKFIGEDVVWIDIGKQYQIVFSNKVIYISDYLADGLTRNRRYNNIKSSKGCYLRALKLQQIDLSLKNLLIAIVQTVVYGKFSNYRFSKMIKDSKHKFLVLIFYFPSILLFYRWKSLKGRSMYENFNCKQ